MSVELKAGDDRAVIDERAGGRLASLIAGGAERLVREEDDPLDAPPWWWGSFLMAPVPGRLAGGKLPWRGEIYQMPPNLDEHRLHGVVFEQAWTVDEADGASAALSCRLGNGWPLGGVMRQRLRLAPGSLEQVVEIEAGRQDMPAGVGWHPWFRRPSVGDVRVRLNADTVLVNGPGLIPNGEVAPVEGDTDLREGPALGDRRLDDVYPEVKGPAVITWPDLEMTISFEPPATVGVVYTPARGFCVEPQTQWPNAPQLAVDGLAGTGLTELEPGETLRVQTVWSWTAL